MAVKSKKDKDKDKDRDKDKGRKAKQKDSTGKAEKQRAKDIETAANPLLEADHAAAVSVLDTPSTGSAGIPKQTKNKRNGAAGKVASRTPNRTPGKTAGASRVGTTDSAILDATLACVAENGFGGITTRHIAEIAGINEVTIFRRFGNKQALLQAVFAREARRIDDVAGQYTGDVEADMLRIASVFGDASQQGHGGVLLGALGQDVEMRELAGEVLLALNRLAQLLGRYMDQGVLKQEPSASALGALLGPVIMDSVMNVGMAGSALDARAIVSAYLQGRLNSMH